MCWCIVLANPTDNALLSIKRVTLKKKTNVKMDFIVPSIVSSIVPSAATNTATSGSKNEVRIETDGKDGLGVLKIYLMCDSYVPGIRHQSEDTREQR